MRTYVAPIGYDSTRVTRPVLSHGLDTDDRIVLIRPEEESDDARANEAVADVERLLQEVLPDVSATLERVPHDDTNRATLQCREIIATAGGEVVVVFAGGPREILVPFVTAALCQASAIDATLLFNDIDGAVREWGLPRVTATIPDPTRDTLAEIAAAEKAISIPELTARTEHSKSTVTRHVSQLDAEGIVETFTEGKTKHVQLTFTGHLLLGPGDRGPS